MVADCSFRATFRAAYVTPRAVICEAALVVARVRSILLHVDSLSSERRSRTARLTPTIKRVPELEWQ